MTGHITIGVFLPNGSQLLDMATVDILGSMSKEYLSSSDQFPAHIAAISPDVTIYYITTPSKNKIIPLTSSAVIQASHDVTDPEVAPGKLDIVIVPGPNPDDEFEEDGLEWLRRQSVNEGTDVLSICTGMYICAAAGITKGRKVSGPRGSQSDLRKKFPDLNLVGDNQRWVRDGNLWSSGGVTNGNDLMAAYAKACGRWPQPVVEMGLLVTEVEDRGQFYEKSSSAFMAGAAWTVLKAWVMSVWVGNRKTKAI